VLKWHATGGRGLPEEFDVVCLGGGVAGEAIGAGLQDSGLTLAIVKRELVAASARTGATSPPGLQPRARGQPERARDEGGAATAAPVRCRSLRKEGGHDEYHVAEHRTRDARRDR